jgi:hypothetical protein
MDQAKNLAMHKVSNCDFVCQKLWRYAAMHMDAKIKTNGSFKKNPQLSFNIVYACPKLSEIIIR